jgi:hypothetical protein
MVLVKTVGDGYGLYSRVHLQVQCEGAEVTCRCIDPSLTWLCWVKTCHGGGSGSRSPHHGGL